MVEVEDINLELIHFLQHGRGGKGHAGLPSPGLPFIMAANSALALVLEGCRWSGGKAQDLSASDYGMSAVSAQLQG